MKNPCQYLAILCLAAAAFASTAMASEPKILEERFAADDRTNSNLPTTTAWYYSGATSEITDTAAGSLSLNTKSGRVLIAHFTPVTLTNVDDSLSLKFTFSGTVGSNMGNSNFRFGVFDTGSGTAVANDGFDTGKDFSGYTGYLIAASTTTAADGAKAYAKKSTNTGILSGLGGSTAGSSQIGGNKGKTAFANDQPYTAELTIARKDATTMSITLTFAGQGFSNYSASWEESAYDYASFDTFAIGMGGVNIFNTLTLSSVDITALLSIPEPATVAILLGAGVFFSTLAFRRFSR